MDAAVAEDRKFFPQTDLRDTDVGDVVWFLGSVEDARKGGQDCIIVVGIGAEVGYRLRDEYIEPVKRFGRVGIDVVVCFTQYAGRGQAGRRP